MAPFIGAISSTEREVAGSRRQPASNHHRDEILFSFQSVF